MSLVIQVASNAIVGKLLNSTKEIDQEIWLLLSYEVEGAQFAQSFNHKWNGKQSLFDYKTKTFPAGFVSRVALRLEKLGCRVQLVKKSLPAPRGVALDKLDDFDGRGGDSRYSYQKESIEQLLRRGRMIAQVATGGGKSRICQMAFAALKLPTIFVTTRSILMYQMKDSFEATFGIQVGVMGDSEWTPRRGFNVAMVQTLAPLLVPTTLEVEMTKWETSWEKSTQGKIKAYYETLVREKKDKKEIERLVTKLYEDFVANRPARSEIRQEATKAMEKHNARHNQVVELLKHFQLVIAEEAHESGSDSYYKVMQACKSADYRLALTATPFMRANAEDNMRLLGCTGEIGIRISEKQLIDLGILAKPFFKYRSCEKPPKLFASTRWPRSYTLGIVENRSRNECIVAEAKKAAHYKLPVLILVQHKSHGKILEKMLIEADIKGRFLFGEDNQKQRLECLNALASGEIEALVATNILDVGVDVPSIGLVILAGGYKAEVTLRQRIGRGLRAKKSGANVAFILDFNDEGNMKLAEHAATRKAIIMNTPGFKEGVLSATQEFNYDLFSK